MPKYLSILILVLFSFSPAKAQNPDINILHRLNKPFYHHEQFWRNLTNSVYWVPPAYLISNLTYGIAANDKEARRFALETTFSTAIGMTITEGLKLMVNRPRPTQTYPDLINTYSYTRSKSFPSGHSALAFATSTTMACQGKRWFVSIPVFTWSGTIGYSRMRLGKHYPTDVLAGAAIGVGSGILGHWITERLIQ